MPRGYGVSQLVEALEYSEHVKFRPAFLSSSVAALRRYVRATHGVTILGAGVAAATEVARGEVVMQISIMPFAQRQSFGSLHAAPDRCLRRQLACWPICAIDLHRSVCLRDERLTCSCQNNWQDRKFAGARDREHG